jgi:hypothetical protein
MGSPPGKGVSAYRFIHRFNLEARHIGIEQNVPMDHKIECWRFANILEANGDSYGFSDSWQPGGLMGLKIHNSNARHGHVWPLVELKLPLRGSQCLMSGHHVADLHSASEIRKNGVSDDSRDSDHFGERFPPWFITISALFALVV